MSDKMYGAGGRAGSNLQVRNSTSSIDAHSNTSIDIDKINLNSSGNSKTQMQARAAAKAVNIRYQKGAHGVTNASNVQSF